MPTLSDSTYDNAKILLIGDQGQGKTGAKAALIAMGYKYLSLDTDNGFKIIKSLLTDPRYPYAAYMKAHGINPEPNISFMPIEVPIDFTTQTVKGIPWDVLGPTSSKAWRQVIGLLKEWKDGDRNFGGINDWDNDVILDLDTMSTLAGIAKYWSQDLNGHLGALSDEHGRDTGTAQELIDRLAIKLTQASVRSNVIATCHIKRVDMSNDIPQSPESRLRDKKSVDPKGFPAIIGQALSPFIGKRFNDQFIVKRDGDGRNSERRIYTVPTDNTDAKNSAWLEPSYPLSTGLAEIFCALRYQDPPLDLIEAIRPKDSKKPESGNQPQTKSGFGSR